MLSYRRDARNPPALYPEAIPRQPAWLKAYRPRRHHRSGGSKGYPEKTSMNFSGNPSLPTPLRLHKESSLLTTCIVSTDDEEIATIARSLGADVPFMRPAELATEESRSLDVMRHALDWMQEHRDASFDYAMILQPTSPCAQRQISMPASGSRQKVMRIPS